MTVKERIQALRSLMLKHNIAAVIVPGTDPHGSEYVAKHWKERNFISGFTGSAGTAVITTEKPVCGRIRAIFYKRICSCKVPILNCLKKGCPKRHPLRRGLGKYCNLMIQWLLTEQ